MRDTYYVLTRKGRHPPGETSKGYLTLQASNGAYGGFVQTCLLTHGCVTESMLIKSGYTDSLAAALELGYVRKLSLTEVTLRVLRGELT